MRYRRGWGGRGRRPKPIMLGHTPVPTVFTPNKLDPTHVWGNRSIELLYSELEALRLVDGEGLDQEEAGKRMGVSRGTVWRLISEARKKIATALAELRPIIITPQDEDQKQPVKKREKSD